MARVPSDVYFRERAPWRIGLVRMECGPVIVAHLHADCEEGAPVHMSFQLDRSGQAVAFARPERETPNMADDRQWREMTADPKFRRVLVTNGRSVVGQEAVAALKAAGAKTVFVGVADPWTVRRRIEAVRKVAPDAAIRMHFHNTRNTGFANVYASLEAGADVIDASTGGIGGCPFAPDATGNIATEDLVYLLRDSDIDVDIDLPAAIAAARVAKSLVGHDLPSAMLRAGDRILT